MLIVVAAEHARDRAGGAGSDDIAAQGQPCQAGQRQPHRGCHPSRCSGQIQCRPPVVNTSIHAYIDTYIHTLQLRNLQLSSSRQHDMIHHAPRSDAQDGPDSFHQGVAFRQIQCRLLVVNSYIHTLQLRNLQLSSSRQHDMMDHAPRSDAQDGSGSIHQGAAFRRIQCRLLVGNSYMHTLQLRNLQLSLQGSALLHASGIAAWTGCTALERRSRRQPGHQGANGAALPDSARIWYVHIHL